ncbi:MAG TPA: hypothetical protein PK850_15845 [Ignavibacteria bacterium]|nr:hypothetical protein [Ignavibacteria bacterium]
MKVTDHYKELGKQANVIIKTSLKNKDLDLLSSNHSFINDFSIWLNVIKDRPESSILRNAIKEFQLAILSNNFGMYQQAFMGLRFFLERTFAAIFFSANEIELNLWKIGERDTYWNEVIGINKETKEIQGIFSRKFCRAFFPELKDEIPHFFAITSKVYRECSEYVHGNKSVIDKIPDKLKYSEELFYEWNSKADTIRRIVLFTFCLRYLNQLKKEEIKVIEATIFEEFKSITQIVDKLNTLG